MTGTAAPDPAQEPDGTDPRRLVLDPDGAQHTLLLHGVDGFEERIHVLGDPPVRFTEADRNWVATGDTAPPDVDGTGDVLEYRQIEDIF